MADQSTQSIVIDAPPADVMAVIADFPAYPQWVGAAKKVEVARGRRRRPGPAGPLRAGRRGVKDDYVLAYTWNGDSRGVLDPGQGPDAEAQRRAPTRLAASDGGTEVTYAITIDLSIPMLGMIKRKAEKVILDTALKELKKRVEG